MNLNPTVIQNGERVFVMTGAYMGATGTVVGSREDYPVTYYGVALDVTSVNTLNREPHVSVFSARELTPISEIYYAHKS